MTDERDALVALACEIESVSYSEVTDSTLQRWADQITEAALAAPVGREGWKLVPVEPNYQMCVAGGFKWESPWEGGFPSAYRAMLAAAPEPPR